MGDDDKALDSTIEELDNDGTQTDEDLLEAGDDQSEDGDESQDTDSLEVEIVLPEDDGSQPKPKHLGIRKRINKLNARNDATTERATTAEADVKVLQAKNELLELALTQNKKEPETALPPDPNNFDDGASDTKYVAALNAHNMAFFDAEFAKRTNVQQNTPKPVHADLERKQNAHYEAADKLGVKDYDDTEDKAIAILGKSAANQLIAAIPDSSPRVLYYLGKNESVAQELADLIKSDPVAGVLKLGALGAQLKVQPKRKSGATPNPDDELVGTTNKARKKRGQSVATYA